MVLDRLSRGKVDPAYRRVLTLGLVSSLAIALSSHGAGAISHHNGLLDVLGIEFFSFGRGVMISTVVLWCGVAGLLWCWITLGRGLFDSSSRYCSTRVMVQASWLFCLPLSLAAPLFSRDVYSYIAIGEMLTQGINPYVFGPAELSSLSVVDVSPDWRSTATPYGPAHLVLLQLCSQLAGNSIFAAVVIQKTLAVALWGALIWSLLRIAKKTSAPASFMLWASTANPLMVIHLVGGMHSEVIVCALLMLAVLAALSGRVLVAGLVLGCAISVKATIIVALPFVACLSLMRRDREPWQTDHVLSRCQDAAAPLVWCVVGTGASFGAWTWLTGLGAGWVDNISVGQKVVNWLSFPSTVTLSVDALTHQGFGPGFDESLTSARLVGMIAAALIVAGLSVWSIIRPNDTFTAMAIALVVFFALNSLAWPWYYCYAACVAGLAWPQFRHRCREGIAVFSALLILVLGPNGSSNMFSLMWGPLSILCAVIVWRSISRAPVSQ